MATRFEAVLCGTKEARLRAAGEQALEEIARMEALLSLYRPDSDVRAINAQAAKGPVRVDPRLFTLLEHCRDLSTATEGAFDITVAPLMRCWDLQSGAGAVPDEATIQRALDCVGMSRVRLDRVTRTVEFERDGVMIDLGAVGKGFAIQRAADLLIENGVESALLHGGTSTLCAIGSQPDDDGWRVALRNPALEDDAQPVREVLLKDCSLSVSAPHGKWFEAAGATYGHVIDPRTGHPTGHGALAAVSCRSATDSDALSTALLVLGAPALQSFASTWPDLWALVAEREQGGSLSVTSSD